VTPGAGARINSINIKRRRTRVHGKQRKTSCYLLAAFAPHICLRIADIDGGVCFWSIRHQYQHQRVVAALDDRHEIGDINKVSKSAYRGSSKRERHRAYRWGIAPGSGANLTVHNWYVDNCALASRSNIASQKRRIAASSLCGRRISFGASKICRHRANKRRGVARNQAQTDIRRAKKARQRRQQGSHFPALVPSVGLAA